MAAVMASKPAAPPTKMKKPAAPFVQVNTNGVKPTQQPSSSPSSATKRLPGQGQIATPVSAVSAAPTSATRPNRRLHRLTTRNTPAENLSVDKKMAKKFPEPYVAKDSHILKKFKGRPPSLIVHLHPTHFRFDQQDGSFSYHSEMRVFIEHLQKGTIPHDMVEEFRKSDVQYYDGWLIVRVVDHRNLASNSASNGGSGDEGKPFSIHNYNPYITPSSYVPYPSKEQTGPRSPPMKQEHRDSVSTQSRDGQPTEPRSDDIAEVLPRSSRPQPKVFHIALRPTILSRHMDLVMDAITPDPKSLNRKQSQANVNARAPGSAAPPTPMSGVPQTPAADRGPPPKRQKMKIDAKDLLDYEARVVNATAPPLFLEMVDDLEEAECVIAMLKDPQHDEEAPSPKSRKRTVAELAADDAHAKEQERFMLIMDERNAGTGATANAGGSDAQASAALFQPRFEKFNTLEKIKREINERKQRDKDRQLQEDENRRRMQEQASEEEKKRILMLRAKEAQVLKLRQQQELAMINQQHQQAQQQAQQQQQQHAQAVQRQQAQQASSIPPQMQSQMMAAQQRSSPVIRQGTPHAASSPVINSLQGGQPMAMTTSQQGHGSPARPGSALQHGHPGAPMARVPSGQEASRNGTPQIQHSTPGMRTTTPIVRQGTPGQHMTQASPHGSMVAPTPPMGHVAAMGQIPNGMPRAQLQQPLNAQQAAEMQRRQALQQQAAMQPQMVNGTPQFHPAQIQAHQQAQLDRQVAMQRHQQQQQAIQHQAQQQALQQQAMQQQQGTPGSQSMSQSPAQSQAQYKQSMADQMKAKMQSVQQGQVHASPNPNQMTPQQQVAQMQQAQQQRMMQQQAMGGNIPSAQQQQQQQQQRVQMNPAMQQHYQQTLNAYTQRFMQQAAQRYGGNTGMLTPHDLQQVQFQAKNATIEAVRKRQMQMNQAALMRQQQVQQQGGMPNGMNMNINVNPNMAAALQQQQAQQMQQMQMQHAQAQMMAQQQGQQLGGGMAGMQQYQQQLHNMQQQQQQQQGQR